MRQFERENPPKLGNDLKWPTFRAAVKKLKLFTGRGGAERPKSLVIYTLVHLYTLGPTFIYTLRTW